VKRRTVKRNPRASGDFGGRRRLLLAGWLGAGALILGRAAQVQILQAADWKRAAEEQHLGSESIPAPRGAILDRNGIPMVLSRERFEIAVAPDEVQPEQKEALVAVLRDQLAVSTRAVRRVESPTKAKDWVVLGTRFGATDRELVRRFHGVHVIRHLSREMPYGDLALGVLGRELDGVWRGGIEQAFDAHLAGSPGVEQSAKDNWGRPIPGQTVTIREPRPGGDLVLTLDVDLQEIAEKELARAIEEHGAQGGDLLVIAPFSGEILALASIQGGNTNALSAINAPYEPGSTLKPFTVAAILEHGVASFEDSIDIGMGYAVLRGRELRDTHGSGVITLAEALRQSSNIGIATIALGLTEQQQFENLRDFGFGTRTALPLPGEVPGRLEAPSEWEKASPVALAIGYEMSVTPLQMALAYGALANGGRLMEPRIVRETRSAGGQVERWSPRVVRQAVEPAITKALSAVLVEVVEDGTGTQAQLEGYRVAGKSGTAKMTEDGKYVAGKYFGSFVGYFPADDPQIVVYAKLDAPRGGAYYGGTVAAPMIRATMEAALASRQSPLSRAKLLRSTRASEPVRAVSLSGLLDSRFVAGQPAVPVDSAGPHPGDLRVPDVSGLSPRSAIRLLHQAGFRVSSEATGPIRGTRPRAGTRLQAGDTVRLVVGAGS
jgi:cell division protein FtsI (penicillin-binding protein 3)